MKKLLISLAIAAGVLILPKTAEAAPYSYQWIGQNQPPAAMEPGSRVDSSITLKNTGTSSWNRDSATPFRLGTSRPLDAPSLQCVGPAYISGWLPGCNRIQLPVATVAPGQTVTIPFKVGAQDYGGRVTQYYQPVVDGVGWMTDIGMYFTEVTPAPVGVLFFNWYGPDGYRWGDVGSMGTTIDTPNFGTTNGYYSSNDMDVARQQLQLIQDTGIDYVILDYWVNHDPQAPYIRANALAIADLMMAEFPDLKFSFLMEGTLAQVPQADYNEIYSHFTDLSGFQKYIGKPVLFSWGIAPTLDPRFAHWRYHDNVTDPNTMYWIKNPLIGKNGTLTLTPSFRSPYFWDVNQTGSFWNSQYAVAKANRDSVKLMTLYGWNEYYEGAMIEPHLRFGTSNAPNKMQQIVKTSLTNWRLP